MRPQGDDQLRREPVLDGVQQATRIEVNGGVVELKKDLEATTVAGSSNVVNVYGGNGAQLQDAVDIAKVGAPGAGAPCPTRDCGHLVRRLVQSGRSTFYCARCQR